MDTCDAIYINKDNTSVKYTAKVGYEFPLWIGDSITFDAKVSCEYKQQPYGGIILKVISLQEGLKVTCMYASATQLHVIHELKPKAGI